MFKQLTLSFVAFVLVSCSGQKNSAPAVPETSIVSESASVTFSKDASGNVSANLPPAYDFGSLSVGQTSRLTLSLTNMTGSDLIYSPGDVDFSQLAPVVAPATKDTCSGKTIKNKYACFITLEFVASKSLVDNLSNDYELTERALTIKGTRVNINGKVLKPIPPTLAEQSSKLIFSSEGLNLGTFSGAKITKTLYISTLNPPVAVAIQPAHFTNPEFSYTTNCPEVLTSKSACVVTVSYNSSQEYPVDTIVSEALIVNEVKVQEISVNHKATVQVVSGAFTWDAPVSFGTVSAIQKKIVYVRNTTGTSLKNLTFNELPLGLRFSRKNCTDSLSSAIKSCYVEIEVDPSKLSANLNFSLTYSNSQYKAVLPITASIVGGEVPAVACTASDAEANRWDTQFAQAISGTKQGTNVSACVVSACLPNYKFFNTSCVPKLCNELSASELSSLAIDLTGATISGTYPSCSLSCSPLKQVASDGKSCEDRNPSGSVSFGQDYTKLLTNQVAVSYQDAAQLQFYSDASCATPSGAPVSLIGAISTSVSPGDGIKNIYAKLINGSKSTSCMTDSIVLDQTLPNLNILSPAQGVSIGENTVTVSGSCADDNFSSQGIVISVGSVAKTAACNSGSFSTNFDLTDVPLGPNQFMIEATDLAGNFGAGSSVSFMKNSDLSLVRTFNFDGTDIGTVWMPGQNNSNVANGQLKLANSIGQSLFLTQFNSIVSVGQSTKVRVYVANYSSEQNDTEMKINGVSMLHPSILAGITKGYLDFEMDVGIHPIAEGFDRLEVQTYSNGAVAMDIEKIEVYTVTRPLAPVNMYVNQQSAPATNGVNLAWLQENVTDMVNIYRSENADMSDPILVGTASTEFSATFFDPGVGLVNDVTYYYAGKKIENGKESAYSNLNAYTPKLASFEIINDTPRRNINTLFARMSGSGQYMTMSSQAPATVTYMGQDVYIRCTVLGPRSVIIYDMGTGMETEIPYTCRP